MLLPCGGESLKENLGEEISGGEDLREVKIVAPIDTSFSSSNGGAAEIGFEVEDVEIGTQCASVVYASSSNQTVIPDSGLFITGLAPTCLLEANPNAQTSGTVEVTVDVIGGSGSDAFTVSIVVTDDNDAPSVSGLDLTYVVTANTSLELSPTLGDVDDTLSCTSSHLSYVSDNTAVIASAGALAILGTWPSCSLTFTPEFNATGISNVTLTVSDGELSSSLVFAVDVRAYPLLELSVDLNFSPMRSQETIGFTLTDLDTPFNCTDVTLASSDTSLVPLSNIHVTGVAPNCELHYKTAGQNFGVGSLTLSANDGNAVASDTLDISVPQEPPGETLFLSARSGMDGQIDLAWVAPNASEGGTVLAYEIHRDTDPLIDTTQAPLVEVAASVLQYSDTTVLNGTPYFYTVVAKNAEGKGDPARVMRALPLAVAAAADANNIWIDPSGNDGTGDGSIGNPYLTLAHAFSIVNPAGFIYVNDGTYPVSANIGFNKAVTIQSVTGDYRTSAAVFTAASVQRFEAANTANVEFWGLELVNIGGPWLKDTDALVYVNCYVRDLNDHFYHDTTQSYPSEGVEIYGSRFENIGDRTSVVVQYSIFNYWYSGDVVTSWLVHRNEFVSTSWNALSFGAAGHKIRHNYFERATDNGIQFHAFATPSVAVGDVEVIGNTFATNSPSAGQPTAYGNAIGIATLGSYNLISFRIEDNTFIDNTVGIRFHDDFAGAGSCDLSLMTGTLTVTNNSIFVGNTTGFLQDCLGTTSMSSNFWGTTNGPTSLSLNPNAIKHFFARELNTKSGWVKIGIWERKYRIDIKKDCVAHVNYS